MTGFVTLAFNFGFRASFAVFAFTVGFRTGLAALAFVFRAGFLKLALTSMAAALAALRARLASFLASFKALRASLNFPFARRAVFRADSTIFSAFSALACKSLMAAFRWAVLIGFVFMASFRRCRLH